MKIAGWYLCLGLCLYAWAACAPVMAAEPASWTVEAYAGNAYNFRTKLKIDQDGGYSASPKAKYETRGFRSPLYYVLRGARFEGQQGYGIGVSFIHHKLYLKDPPEGVADLSISHGFNLLTFDGLYRSGNWVYRFGAGPVFTHAEATINGTKYDGRYRLKGLGAMAAVGRRFYVSKSAYLSVEGMVTAAYATPGLSGPPNARLRVENVALHGLVGVGYEF